MPALPTRLPPAVLDAEEEVSLARAMEAGTLAGAALRSGDRPFGATTGELTELVQRGQQARRRLIETNLRLVAMVSYQAAARTGLSESELFQEGSLGLLDAVQRFDHRRGCRFATYALFWIRAYVGAATAGQLGDLNLPTGRAAQLRAVRGIQTTLTQTLGRAATPAEVAAAVGRSADWVESLLGHLAPESLTALEEEAARLPAPSEVPVAEIRARDATVGRLLDRLAPPERAVVELRLGFGGTAPQSYAAVARRLRLSVGRVRRFEAAALERLREICPQSAATFLHG